MMGARDYNHDPADRDPGELEAFALTGDVWHASHAAAVIPPLPAEGSPKLARAEMKKIREALRLQADVEKVRASFWATAPAAARMVAMMAAGFPKTRANEPLANLDAFERGRAYLAVEKLVDDLERLMKSLQGGKIPEPGAH